MNPTRRVLSILAVAIALLISGFLATPALARDILMISSYHPDFPWTQGCEQGLEQRLGANYRFTRFYLDSKRQSPEKVAQYVEQAWEQVQQEKPNLVVLGDDNALRLLGPRLSTTGIPVVYYGINQNPRHYFAEGGLPLNITGVLERMPLKQSFRYFSKLLPEARRALVLFDLSQTSRALIEQNFPGNAQPYIAGIETEYRVLQGWAGWQQVIRHAEEYDFLVLSTFFSLRDPQLGTLSSEKVVAWSSEHSKVPIFSSQVFSVADQGVVGALVVEPVQHGALAAELVLEILEKGRDPVQIRPQMDRSGQLYLNRAQLKRFDLEVPESLRSSVLYR